MNKSEKITPIQIELIYQIDLILSKNHDARVVRDKDGNYKVYDISVKRVL